MRRILSAGLVLLAVAGCGDLVTNELDDTAPPDDGSTSSDISDANNGGNDHFYWLPPVVRRPRYSGVPAADVSPSVEICLLDRQALVCEPGEPLLARFVMDGAPVWDRVYQGWGGNYWVTWRRRVFTPEQDESYRISVKVEDLELGFFDIEVRRGGRWWNLTRNDGFIGIADSGPFLFGFRIEEGALEQAFCDAAGQGLEDCDVQQVNDETGGTLRLFNAPGGTQQAPAAVITIPQNSAMLGGVPISEYVFIAELEDEGVTQGGAVPQGAQIPFLIDIRTDPPGIEFDPNGGGVQITICQDVQFLAGIPEALHPFLRPFLVFEGGETILPKNFDVGSPECEGYGLADHDHGTQEGLGLLQRFAAGVTRASKFLLPTPLNARRLHGGLNTTVYNTRGSEGNDGNDEDDENGSDNAPGLEFNGEEFVVEVGALLDVDPARSEAVVPNGEVGETTEMVIHSLNGLMQAFPFGGSDVEVTVGGANAEASVTLVDNEDGTYSASYTPQDGGQDQITITINGVAISGSPYPSDVVGFGDIGATVLLDGQVPLGGVTIDLYSPAALVTSAMTDEYGQVLFEDLPYGDYFVQAASGYDFDVRFPQATQAVSLGDPTLNVDFDGTTQALPAGAQVWRIADGGNGNAYRYVLGNRPWTTANAEASADVQLGVAGHLTTLTSLEETLFANSLRGSGDMRAWIGLTDATVEGTFQWVTGEAFVYSNWDGSEPSNGGVGGNEDYVEMYAATVWNDNTETNGVNQGYIVEWDADDAYPVSPITN